MPRLIFSLRFYFNFCHGAKLAAIPCETFYSIVTVAYAK
jgi:hypothetical protein